MAYRINQGRDTFSKNQSSILMTKDDVFSHIQNPSNFFQWEEAVVLDPVLDNDNNIILNKQVDPAELPKKPTGEYHTTEDSDYSWVGKIKVRLCQSERGINPEHLNYAIPLYQNQTQIPLPNEIVFVVKIFGHYYYTPTLNLKGKPNHNADLRYEKHFGLYDGITGTDPQAVGANNAAASSNIIQNLIQNIGNVVLNPIGQLDFQGNTPGGPQMAISSIGDGLTQDRQGAIGQYFKSNDNIRALKHFEGDTIHESRFGSGIRMGAYGTNTIPRPNTQEPITDPNIDQGINNYAGGYGNPQLLISNNHAPRSINGPDNTYYYKILEDVNGDGSSIHMTSGRTISQWAFATNKSIFANQNSPADQPNYVPEGASNYQFPSQTFSQNYDTAQCLCGDQIVINSDRLIFQSKQNETIISSKRRLAMVTDAECTIDAHQQIVMTTNTSTCINSPFIFLGQYNQSREPALLGQTTIDWLYDLIEWLKIHNHYHPHVHINSGREVEPTTTQPSQIQQLNDLQQALPNLCSKRVFLVGGGYAPGSDGGYIQNGSAPGTIQNIPGGYFVPPSGQFKGVPSNSEVGGIQYPFAPNPPSLNYGGGEGVASGVLSNSEGSGGSSGGSGASSGGNSENGVSNAAATNLPTAPNAVGNPLFTNPSGAVTEDYDFTKAKPIVEPNSSNSISAQKTEYGYADDPSVYKHNVNTGTWTYVDHNTALGIGRWNNKLTPNGCAPTATVISALNLQKADIVQLTDSSGNCIFAVYEDLAPEGNNRVDLYSPLSSDYIATHTGGNILVVNIGGGSPSATSDTFASQQARCGSLNKGGTETSAQLATNQKTATNQANIGQASGDNADNLNSTG